MVRESNPKEAYDLLRRTPSLIPHGILAYDWKVLDLSSKGLEVLGKTQKLFVSLKEGRIDSLSIAYPRRQQNQSMWATTIYAKEPLGFLSQLNHNINVAKEQEIKAMMGTYHIEHEKTLRDTGVFTNRRWHTHMVLLEKRIRSKSARPRK